MGIQINGQTDTISASDGGLVVSGQQLTGVTDINASGIGTFGGGVVVNNGVTLGTGTTISSPASDTFAVSTNGSERIRVDSSGRLAIGTTSPGQLLHLQGSSPALQFEPAADSQNSLIIFRNAADSTTKGLIYYNHSNDSLNFTTNGTTTDAVIDSSGRLLVGTSNAYGSARIQARTTGSTATDGSLTLVTVAAAGGDAPNPPYAVTRAVYGSACNSGATETIRTLASREIAFIKIFYSWPAGTPEWKTGAYDYNGSTVSTNWFHESNAGHAFTLGVSGGVLTLTQSVGVTMNMVIEIEYIDSSGLD